MTASATTPNIVLITGAMAAGKSTVAQHLAQGLTPSVHLRGDVFRRMVVNGRKDMSSAPDADALQQLYLRYQAAAATAKIYVDAGFSVVYQDVVIGPALHDVVAEFHGYSLHVVVLCPNAETIRKREQERPKTGYHNVSIAQLQDTLASTPNIGFWLDSSEQTVAETTAVILENLPRAKIHYS